MKPLVVLACLAITVHAAARAINLGVVGPTYKIDEPHLLEDIEKRLREKQRTGELQRLADAAQRRGVAAVREPAPVEGLRPTEQPRTFHIDPSFTLDRNISDHRGRLLFAAGTRKNPLEVVSLSRHLLFFDARDPRQVRHARELKLRYAGRVKPILTAGSYLDLMKAWREPVYYDQSGALTRRLGIRQVPALVSQDGLRLRVDELKLP
jgi:conjugal transfer pilus assembly protein TraW